jgi:hypothetical protein
MSSPGILRQYLEDYAHKEGLHYRDWRKYDKTIPKDKNGDPLLYYVDRYRKGSFKKKRTYYHQMYKSGDSWNASDHGSKHSPGSLVPVPEASKVYMRQDKVPQYDKAGNLTGYVFLENPGEFTVKKPTFTVNQYKKLTMPTSGKGIAQSVRSTDGIIGRFLGREE